MITERLLRSYYYSRPTFVDGTTEFHRLVEQFIPANEILLEIGAGPSNATSKFLASRAKLIGVDVSDAVLGNTWVLDAKIYDGRHLPFRDNSFQMCVSDFVLEHLLDPLSHFREVERVLRPSGVYCFRTPNLWHYVPFASRVLPHRLHVGLANRLRGLAETAHPPYPTVYAANTRVRIECLSRAAGLSVHTLRWIEKEPSYGAVNPALFLPMMAYERLVNSSSIFERFRINILGVLQKQSEGTQALPV